MSDFASLSGQLAVAGVDGDASESDHSGRIEDADHLVSDLYREPPPERRGGVWKKAHLEQLPSTPGFEDVEGPVLSFSLSCGNALLRDL